MRKTVLIIILALLTLNTGCGSRGSNNASSGSTAVTIHLGQPGASPGNIAGAAAPSSTIPSGVDRVRVTVSADDMDTVQTVVSVAGQASVTVTIEVPTGTDRHFLIEALDSSGNVLYSGSATADLEGEALELPVALLTTTWARSFGGTGSDTVSEMQQTADGGSITIGTSNSFGVDSTDKFWVLKLDSSGSAEWQKTFGFTISDTATSISQTADGGYIVAGYSEVCGDGCIVVIWLLKLAGNGAIEWQKTYDETINIDSKVQSIRQTSDGGYVVAGTTGSAIWVLKLNNGGDVIWQKSYSLFTSAGANEVQQTSDGGYIIAGFAISSCAPSCGFPDNVFFFIMKLAGDGTLQWQKTYENTATNNASAIQQTSDGGYIVAGSSTVIGNSDFWVLKLGADGSVQWQKTYNGGILDSASSIRQTADGGYIVAGAINPTGPDSDMWILKLGSDGAVQWQKRYGGTGVDMASSVQQTSDGNYIVAGTTSSFGAGGNDFWVLKLLSNGYVNLNTSGGAVTADTASTISNTTAVVTDITNMTPVDTTATVSDTTITGTDTNATMSQQGP